jgi:choline dehydrogenase
VEQSQIGLCEAVMTNASYDYIIVGAGSAGCVLAERLSRDPHRRVLLLEAGGSDHRFWIRTPLGYVKTFADPELNWCYSTAPDPGLNGRVAFWPRGKVIGGSSSINAMAYLRGLPHDFDDWERAGAGGWNWSAVKATYEALESHIESDGNGGSRQRGSGPVVVSDLSARMHPFSRHFLNAATDLGWKVVDTLNGSEHEGLTRMRSTVRDGRRWSAADAFLRPAERRFNLRILSGVLVEKILFEGNRATGVSYTRDGQRHSDRASKEVIVSAGAVNSPQLLQLSGLGPAALLKSHGIDVQRDLPQVGQGMQDHLALSHYYRANEPTLNNILGIWPGKISAGLRYVLTRNGPLSVPVNQVSGFVRSNAAARAPDLQIYCNPMSYIVSPSGMTDVDPEPGFLLCAQPCRPTSRGSVEIASNNAAEAPVIQPNSLSTEEDRAMAIAAGRAIRALAETPAIRAVTAKRLAPDITTMSDDEMLENFRNQSGTVYHPSCTCRMGSDVSDSVLDARLRVHGIAGLRVVDASAFPNVTSGNINAPVLMLAARAAEMIVEDA